MPVSINEYNLKVKTFEQCLQSEIYFWGNFKIILRVELRRIQYEKNNTQQIK